MPLRWVDRASAECHQRDVLARKSMELLFIRHALPLRVEGFEGPADPELVRSRAAPGAAPRRLPRLRAHPRRVRQPAAAGDPDGRAGRGPAVDRGHHRRRDRRVRPGGLRVHPDRAAQGGGPPRLAGRAHRRRPPQRRRRSRTSSAPAWSRPSRRSSPPIRARRWRRCATAASSTPTSPMSSASPIRAASSIPTTRRSTGSPRPAAASAACSRSTRRATCAGTGLPIGLFGGS